MTSDRYKLFTITEKIAFDSCADTIIEHDSSEQNQETKFKCVTDTKAKITISGTTSTIYGTNIMERTSGNEIIISNEYNPSKINASVFCIKFLTKIVITDNKNNSFTLCPVDIRENGYALLDNKFLYNGKIIFNNKEIARSTGGKCIDLSKIDNNKVRNVIQLLQEIQSNIIKNAGINDSPEASKVLLDSELKSIVDVIANYHYNNSTNQKPEQYLEKSSSHTISTDEYSNDVNTI